MLYALKLVAVPEGTPTDLLGKILKLKKMPATLGRGKDATVVVRHRKLSRLHCRFYVTEEQLYVRDLGSTNGTVVNGQRAEGPQVLKLGDEICLGGVVFQLGQLIVPTSPVTPVLAAEQVSEREGERPPVPRSETGTPPVVAAQLEFAAPPALANDETVDWRPTLAPDVVAATHPTGSGEFGGSPLGADQSWELPSFEEVFPGVSHARVPADASMAPQPSSVPATTLDLEPDLGGGPAAADSGLPDSGLPGSDFVLAGVPVVTPVSSVQIDSTFIAKAGTADPAALPDLSGTAPAVIDPAEVDLGDMSDPAKTASMTALGEFMERQNLRKG